MTVSSFHGSVITLLMIMLSGCQGNNTINGEDNTRNFRLENVGKSDIDMIFDYQVKTTHEHLDNLMLKLYKRNPAYWRNSGFKTAKHKVDHLMALSEADLQSRLSQKRSIDAISLAFDESFQGDRVLAFVFGLKSMLSDAYEGKRSFFIMDQLDPQKLYNAARNIEVAVWKLSNDRRPDGGLYLVSNELRGEIKNLSFERLFGKLIAIQDSSARIVADSTNRTIKNVLQGVARFVFLPI